MVKQYCLTWALVIVGFVLTYVVWANGPLYKIERDYNREQVRVWLNGNPAVSPDERERWRQKYNFTEVEIAPLTLTDLQLAETPEQAKDGWDWFLSFMGLPPGYGRR